MASQLPRSQVPASSVLDPRRILDMNYAFVSITMLMAAVRLHFFTHLARQALTPAALAALAHTTPESKVAEMALKDRYTWIEADMEMIEYPSCSYDLVILAHVCRFIGEERARALLRKLTQSLRLGGTLLLADIFFSDDRSSPAATLTLDLSMLVNTAQGRIRTWSEISEWLKDSGLSEVQRFDGVEPFRIITAQKGEDV